MFLRKAKIDERGRVIQITRQEPRSLEQLLDTHFYHNLGAMEILYRWTVFERR